MAQHLAKGDDVWVVYDPQDGSVPKQRATVEQINSNGSVLVRLPGDQSLRTVTPEQLQRA